MVRSLDELMWGGLAVGATLAIIGLIRWYRVGREGQKETCIALLILMAPLWHVLQGVLPAGILAVMCLLAGATLTVWWIYLWRTDRKAVDMQSESRNHSRLDRVKLVTLVGDITVAAFVAFVFGQPWLALMLFAGLRLLSMTILRRLKRSQGPA